MTNPGVMDPDDRGEMKVVLANLGDQPYRVEKGDRIAQLIIKKFNNRELQEVTQLDDTEKRRSGDQKLRHQHGPRGQGLKCPNTNGNQ